MNTTGTGQERGEADPGMLAARLRAEFREMPGLLLTSAQTARLGGVDPLLCERLLAALVDARVLARTADGRYRRRDGA